MPELNYNYDKSKAAYKQYGLMWLGDDWRPLVDADAEAHILGFTQEQMDSAMRNCLWHVRCLFTPQNYKWYQRILLALYFLTGLKIR